MLENTPKPQPESLQLLVRFPRSTRSTPRRRATWQRADRQPLSERTIDRITGTLMAVTIGVGMVLLALAQTGRL